MILANALWFPEAATLRAIAPECILVATAVALLLSTFFAGRRTPVLVAIALLGVFVAAISTFFAGGAQLFSLPLSSIVDGTPIEFMPASVVLHRQSLPPPPGMLAIDGFTNYFRLLLIGFLGAIVLMWTRFDAARQDRGVEFLALLFCSAAGMCFMSAADNLLLMILAIETASMPSYALAAFDRSRRSAEAALKYALFGAVTTGIALFGASLLYGISGSLHIPAIASAIAQPAALVSPALVSIALLAVFVTLAFKISAVPVHFWCPDVFEGASLTIATWLSVASKAAAIVLLSRIAGTLVSELTQVGDHATTIRAVVYILGFVATLTFTVANIAAFRQRSIRRLLAYSSIAHAGYMLAAVAAAAATPAVLGSAQSAVAQYLLIYVFMNFAAFFALGLVAADSDGETLEHFTGLGWRNPLLAISITVCLFSLVGLPPLAGFVAKFWLIAAIADAASQSVAGPVLWIVLVAYTLNTAISLYYYARIVREMFLRETTTKVQDTLPVPAGAIVTVLAIALLLLGTVLAPHLKNWGDAAVRNHGNSRAGTTGSVDTTP